ncbi:MAG: L-fucose/L-arabinose isomerase family protein [Candidatus Humimicrobiaceae bacterium]
MYNKNYNVKLGLAPTSRLVYSRKDTIKYKNLIKEKLQQLKINFVDIDWLNEDGLLYDPRDVEVIIKRFNSEEIDALFCPHCNYGMEEAVAKLAKKMNKPFLLWGPRDEAPTIEGARLRDSLCGIFATSKVLRILDVPFTYIENCRIEDKVFYNGLENFISAAAVVNRFKNMRIGQIGTRPQSFLTVMYNEEELRKKFGIEIIPITLIEIIDSMNKLINNNDERIKSDIKYYKQKFNKCNFDNDVLSKISALKYAIKDWAEEEHLLAVALQCWTALQNSTGIMPCFVNSELTGEGLPVMCETDVCGAVSAIITQTAAMGETPIFFADLTIRHPENNNAVLLWHCGPFPYKLKKEGTEGKIVKHYLLDSKCPGVGEWEIKGGDISLCRFDGDNGKYSFMITTGKGINGPKVRGTYLWTELKDWSSFEKKIVYGPYIHHVVGIHAKVSDVLVEALKYIPGVEVDLI